MLKQKFYIDTHKGITWLVIAVMINYFQQWGNPTAWAYLALHGGYGILWVIKSRIFPDRQWEEPASLAYGLAIWGGLSLYWVSPWLLTSWGLQVPGWYLGICLSLYIAGVFLHFAGDMQKYVSLQLNPEHLFTGGLFSRVRNINYFGELLIYTGFGLLARHWLPLAILALWVVAVWLPRMRRKDRSLARYPEFEAYRARSWLFIPFIF